MGSSKYINVGAYLKVKSKISDINNPYLTCVNVDCKSNRKVKKVGKFCVDCGLENMMVDNIIKSKVNIDSILENFGGWDFLSPNVYSDNYTIYSLNRNGKLSMLHIDGYDDEGEFDIPDREESLKNFNTQCSDFLEYLKNNDFEFEVKFGVVTYWN